MPVAQPVADLPKTNWADEEDVVNKDSLPTPTEVNNPDGTITITEYRFNEDGKKVKITRKVRRRTQVREVSHAVAERKQWSKFGAEKGKAAGPDRATTTVGENINLKISVGGQKVAAEPDESSKMKAQLGAKKIMCRICKGDHFTSKCPIKDTLEGAGLTDMLGGGDMPPAEDGMGVGGMEGAGAGGGGGGGIGGKYVPPSMRAGAKSGPGDSMFRSRDELPTLRITSLSTDADEDDLRNLFGKFGRIARANVVRDRETQESKGLAFVSFELRSEAEKAMVAMNGRGYDHQILQVAWSEPKGPRPA